MRQQNSCQSNRGLSKYFQSHDKSRESQLLLLRVNVERTTCYSSKFVFLTCVCLNYIEEHNLEDEFMDEVKD